MPSYYNPYMNNYMSAAYPYAPQQTYMPNYQNSYQASPSSQYMINVDGEMAARAWSMPANLPPNTVIPLWDLDGQHVYFRSVDAYGRLNPLKKGRVVFDEEPQNLPQGTSGEVQPVESYMTKEDFKNEMDQFKNEIKSMMQIQGNQNGSNPSGHPQNRGNK